MKTEHVTGYVQEKAIEQVGNFPKEQLNHVDTDVKCPLPTLSGKFNPRLYQSNDLACMLH